MKIKIRIRDIVLANWHLKLMSLGLAILIWFLVTEAGNEEIAMDGILLNVSAPEELSVWKMSRDTVKVTLEGPAGQLRALRPGEVVGKYAVVPGRPGEGFVVDLDCEKDVTFLLPAGIRVSEVRPRHVRVEVVPKKEARVNVEAQLVGRPQMGYEITDVKIVPAKVRVRGPEPALKDLRAVQTLPINCDGRTESFVDRVNIQRLVKGYRLEIDESVQLRVQISQELDNKVLSGLKILTMVPAGLKENVSVMPDVVDITLKGQKQVLGALSREKVVPFVRVNETGPGGYRLPVEVSIYIEGVEVVGVLPTVEVTVGTR